MTQNNDIVTFQNISKRYGPFVALNNVSFSIKKGEIFGYVGPNGAGKTTTIKILVGLLRKTGGNLFINGYKMPEQKELAHRFIGYTPQQIGLQKWKNIRQMLTTFGILSGYDKRLIDRRIDELLTIFNLIKFKNTKISKLSGGMIQKLGIIQALFHKPPILILDEPLSGLDPESRFQTKNLLKQLSKNGTTIFFSSHILSDVQDIATKICILNWGQVLKIGTLEEFKNEFTKEKQIEIILSKRSEKLYEINNISGILNIIEKSAENIIVNIEKTKNSDEIIHNIIKTLLINDCKIRSISPVNPSIDEVYQFYLRRGGGYQ